MVPFSVKATGDLGNEPTGGYSEGSDTFLIARGDTATTTFAPGELITVTLTTVRVDLNGNGELVNELYLTDVEGADMSPYIKFSQTPTIPYTYAASISAPTSPDHYLLNARIVDNNTNEFIAKDVIIVWDDLIPQITPQKYIKTFSDDTYSKVDWTFTSQDTIYIEVYASQTPNSGQSSVTFADYSGGESYIKLGDLSDNTITMNGSYAQIQYDLLNDLNPADLTNNALNKGYWYTLSLDLRLGGGEVITNDWTIQIRITDVVVVEPSLSVQEGSTNVDPNTVEREGNYITTIRTEFKDTDEPKVNSFIITFKVRDPNNEEITIVDRKRNGQSGEFGGTLTVFSPGGGVYTASYELDPDSSFTTGFYDLYFEVEDGTGEVVEDGYQNNRNELQITSSTLSPEVDIGATQCDPNEVDKIGEYMTTISAQFSDSDSLSVTDFSVLFKIRGPDDREIVLVNNKMNGQPGEFGGSLSIISSAQGEYMACYTFDPDGSFKTGYYDLYFKVTDQHGNSDIDEYFWNLFELRITSSAAEPTVVAGSTQVIPDVVDKAGDGVTTISAQFEDTDSDSVDNFTVTFKVKDEDGNEYVIVDSAKNGDDGEHGGTVVITSSSPNEYVASYIWNPPSSMPNGNYSLYFKVEDEHGSFAEDGYADNIDELMIIGEVEEDQEEQEGIQNWIWIPLILIILVIFLILLLMARRRKGKPSYMPPKTTEEDKPPPSSYDELSPSPSEQLSNMPQE